LANKDKPIAKGLQTYKVLEKNPCFFLQSGFGFKGL